MPDRARRGRRRDDVVARRQPARLQLARARRGVRRRGRKAAQAAPVLPAAVQARQRGLDRRPAAASLHRRGGRLGAAEPAHRRRLRGPLSGLVAGREQARVHLGPPGGLGHRARPPPLRRRSGRRRARAADGGRSLVRRARLVAGRLGDRLPLQPRRLQLSAARPDRRAARDRRAASAADDLARPQLLALPGDPRAGLGRRVSALRARGRWQQPPLPRARRRLRGARRSCSAASSG